MTLSFDHQRWRRCVLLAAAGLATLVLGCASALTLGDRAFRDGNLGSACSHYLRYLTADPSTRSGESRARYRAGLCMALPGTELYDPERSRQAFETVAKVDPQSLWGRQADHVLSLGRERDRFAAELAAQSERADFLLTEVARLGTEAERAEDEIEDRDERLESLNAEIGRLRKSLTELAGLLAAREQELEQIKRIDLQTPP